MHELAAVGALVDSVATAVSEHRHVGGSRPRAPQHGLLRGGAAPGVRDARALGRPSQRAGLEVEVVDRDDPAPAAGGGPSRRTTFSVISGSARTCGHVEDIGGADDLVLAAITLQL